jgi:hypothetical protein
MVSIGHCTEHGDRILPDLFGVVLNPPGPRIDLTVFARNAVHDCSRRIE